MKLKKFHKLLTIVSIVILLFIVVMLWSSRTILKKNRGKRISNDYEIALIKYDTIDNLYFELVEQGVKKAATSFSKSYKVLNVSDYNASNEETLKTAVEDGATIVVLPDASFEEVVYNYQKVYPYTTLVLVDGIPRNADGSDTVVNNNVLSVQYDEAEAGFFAGYASVCSGYRKLTFVCEDNSLKSMHFCYGFLQGADYAAGDLGISDVLVQTIHRNSDENVSMVMDRISKETDIIATLSTEVVEAVRDTNYKIIFCGGYNMEAENVVATVNNDITAIVNDVIVDLLAKNVEGGTTVNFDTSNNNIAFQTEGSYFEAFTKDVRKSLSKRIEEGDITIISDTTVTTEELGLMHITVRNK